MLWVTLFQGRVPLVDAAAPFPWLKEQLAKLPEAILNPPPPDDPKARGAGMVLAMNLSGRILFSLQNPPLQVNTLSCAVPRGDDLFLGTIGGGPILRHRLSGRPQGMPMQTSQLGSSPALSRVR